MLKWTASAQKMLPHATPTAAAALRTPRLSEAKRRRRRATIADKENIPFTSTPMVPHQRNSPLLLAPLMDILNITPERPVPRTPERTVPAHRPPPANRRHSTIGITLPSTASLGIYSSTLPRFEEEYSPSTELPTGQQLAMRGLLPDPFLGHPRYFATPELTKVQSKPPPRKSLPQKRKLEQEFAAIAAEVKTKKPLDETGLVSAKMGDQTLDKLIDAILDSARKEDKKKEKPRKSFNLRRRTLLKNQVECVQQQMLSPSYAPGDDPASDLSFLLMEPPASILPITTTQTIKRPVASVMPPTPAPATPPPGTPLPAELLRQLPTPQSSCSRPPQKNDSFMLATPAPKRHRKRHSLAPSAATKSPSKRLKVDAQCNYLEIGLALPSIYV